LLFGETVSGRVEEAVYGLFDQGTTRRLRGVGPELGGQMLGQLGVGEPAIVRRGTHDANLDAPKSRPCSCDGDRDFGRAYVSRF
jgi:hypothetical protein